MEQTKTEQLLDAYLKALGIVGYRIKSSQDNMGFLITVEVPKENDKKIGILKGKNGRNLQLLKQLLRVVGFLENRNPFVIIKLTG